MVKSFIPFAVAMLFAGAPLLACEYPPADGVMIADGATATEAEMLESQQAVNAYIRKMEAFVECLGREIEAIEEPTVEARQMRNLRHNAAVGAMEDMAERFNVQVRKYRARFEQ